MIFSRAPGVFLRAVSAKLAARGTLRRDPLSPGPRPACTPLRGPRVGGDVTPTPPGAGLVGRSKPTGTLTTPPAALPGSTEGVRVVSDLIDWFKFRREVARSGRFAARASTSSSSSSVGSVSLPDLPPRPSSTRTAGREPRSLARSGAPILPLPRMRPPSSSPSARSTSSDTSRSARSNREAKLNGFKTSVRLIGSDIAQTLVKTADKGIINPASVKMTNSQEAAF